MRVATVLALAVLLAGCGGGSELVVRPPTSRLPSPTGGSPTPTATGSATVNPKVAVSPATGLKDGQTVHVKITGFSPGQGLVVLECADKGSKTGQGDCDLTGLVPVTTDADGGAEADLVVHTGPFGANNVSCTATQPCLVSASQANPKATQEADTRISFG